MLLFHRYGKICEVFLTVSCVHWIPMMMKLSPSRILLLQQQQLFILLQSWRETQSVNKTKKSVIGSFLTVNCRVFSRNLMEPNEVEFLAEKEMISIVPNFSQDKIYLIEVCMRNLVIVYFSWINSSVRNAAANFSYYCRNAAQVNKSRLSGWLTDLFGQRLTGWSSRFAEIRRNPFRRYSIRRNANPNPNPNPKP